MPHIAIANVKGLTPYSQSRPHNAEKLNKETHEAYERRTWRERLHTDDNGNVTIHPMAFKNCIAEAAQFLSIQIPGKGKSTYTKHFVAGVLVLDPPELNIHKDDIQGDWVFVPSDGKKGGGTRVWKCYPIIPPNWKTRIEFTILDDTITKEVFHNHLMQAGQLIGIGRFRPRNGGYYGRYIVEDLKWEELK